LIKTLLEKFFLFSLVDVFFACEFFWLMCSHSDGFTFSFALMQKNKVTKRKNQGYVSGATAERSFWC